MLPTWPPPYGRGEFPEIADNEIGLMRRFSERAAAPINERGAHAVRFRADAIEGVIGDEQTGGAVQANQFLGLGVGLPVRLEITRPPAPKLTRVEAEEADIRAPAATSMSRSPFDRMIKFVAAETQPVQRRDHVGENGFGAS